MFKQLLQILRGKNRKDRAPSPKEILKTRLEVSSLMLDARQADLSEPQMASLRAEYNELKDTLKTTKLALEDKLAEIDAFDAKTQGAVKAVELFGLQADRHNMLKLLEARRKVAAAASVASAPLASRDTYPGPSDFTSRIPVRNTYSESPRGTRLTVSSQIPAYRSFATSYPIQEPQGREKPRLRDRSTIA